MKTLIAILTASCLALAGSVQAAKPEEANKKEKSAEKPKAQKQQATPKQQAAPKQQAGPKRPEAPKREAPAAPKTEHPSKKARTTAPKKEERTAPAVESERKDTVESKKIKPDKPDKAPKLQTDKAPDPTNVVADDKLQKDAKATAKIKKLDSAAVQKIRAQHRGFKAKPNTSIAGVQFNQNYQITSAQNWTGPQYEVFRTYRPQWHDRSWWSTRYSTISLIGGGWYYWDSGYWYPAWGYDEAAAYYPYDGPIYVGSDPRPFDQVVADVQAVLQEMGYYRGEVDGLLGPLTRQALADYQSANGLYTTQTIDQPTLDSLGLT